MLKPEAVPPEPLVLPCQQQGVQTPLLCVCILVQRMCVPVDDSFDSVRLCFVPFLSAMYPAVRVCRSVCCAQLRLLAVAVDERMA